MVHYLLNMQYIFSLQFVFPFNAVASCPLSVQFSLPMEAEIHYAADLFHCYLL